MVCVSVCLCAAYEGPAAGNVYENNGGTFHTGTSTTNVQIINNITTSDSRDYSDSDSDEIPAMSTGESERESCHQVHSEAS